jgi:hypothetical protein
MDQETINALSTLRLNISHESYGVLCDALAEFVGHRIGNSYPQDIEACAKYVDTRYPQPHRVYNTNEKRLNKANEVSKRCLLANAMKRAITNSDVD